MKQHAADAALDWARVASWTEGILAGDLKPIRAAFARAGGDGPSIDWNPDAAIMAAPQLAFLLDYYRALAPQGGFPAVQRVDPLGMRPALGYVMLVDPVDGGSDFRYRLYGSAVAGVSGFDMTGRLVSAHPAGLPLAEYSLAVYRAVLVRKLALLAIHSPASTQRIKAWHRLVLPLGDGVGGVARLLIGAVPLGDTGRALTSRF